jgi:hypothetical protein
MNIFVLDEDPEIAARMHCDKHVVKMVLETAQLLCTAIDVHTEGKVKPLYRTTHKNHPCAVWVRESIENFLWTAELGLRLAEEYTHRYGKRHKSENVIRWCLDNCPNFPHIPMTERPLCMPDDCKIGNVVTSYRVYYRNKAESITMAFTNRTKPAFMEN